MKINDVDLNADFYDADVMDRYQSAMKSVVEECSKISADETVSAGDGIRVQCKAVMDCFDTIYGAGTAKMIFGDRTNLKECFAAFMQLKKESERQGREMAALARRVKSKKV